MAVKKGDKPRQGKVLPPNPPDVNKTNILAVFTEFHERPDLLLDAIEKRSPGATKRMAEEAERVYQSRFRFGEIQAYTGLAIRVVSALSCPVLFYLIVTGDGAKFWPIVALTAFFAVTQSGKAGFLRICQAIAELIAKSVKGNNRDD